MLVTSPRGRAAWAIDRGRAPHLGLPRFCDRVSSRMVLLQVFERASLFSNGLPAVTPQQYCPPIRPDP